MQRLVPSVEIELSALRETIDGLNHELLDLLQRRARVVLKIADLKREQGLDGYDPRREREMLQALTRSCSGPFKSAEIEEVFKSIFRVSLKLQVQRWRSSSD